MKKITISRNSTLWEQGIDFAELRLKEFTGSMASVGNRIEVSIIRIYIEAE